MNSIHNNGENGSSFKDDLDKLSRSYGQLEQVEPPELLDQTILNTAHRAVEKKPHWINFGWLHGLTTAAIFVLAFSLILNQREPVPVYENGMRNNEPPDLVREQTVRKPSADPMTQPANEFRKAKSPKSDDQRDRLQRKAITDTLESETQEVIAEPPSRQRLSIPQKSSYTQGELIGESVSGEQDAVPTPMRQEDLAGTDADLMLDATAVDENSVVAGSAAVANKPALSEDKSQIRADSEAGQKLLVIIKMKRNGDEAWKTELESFKQRYPGYPLPDELKS